MTAINALVQSGMPGAIQALRRYQPLYVQKQYSGQKALLQNTSVALMKTLDQAAKPSEAPVCTAARMVLAELVDGEQRLQAAYAMATGEIEAGVWVRSGAGALPGWTKGQLVQVFADKGVPLSQVVTAAASTLPVRGPGANNTAQGLRIAPNGPISVNGHPVLQGNE